ncbi:MAG: magnesium chelatase subunit H [Woeseiaceae bacterium]|nr:magnesium chelatase subunit H [Woeseiaceae bacterium]
MPKRTSSAEAATLRVALITLDGHLAGAAERAFGQLRREAPGLECSLHCAGEWASHPELLEDCKLAIAEADILIVCMMFMEEHFSPILPALTARRYDCDAMLCFMSAGEVMKLTRIGGFTMDGTSRGPLAMLKRLRGSKKNKTASSGARQMAMLRRLPRILRFIPGTAQDVRAYFLAMQYWLSGSQGNIRNLIALMVSRYADGERRHFREQVKVGAPREYPDVGVYHPTLKKKVSARLKDLPTKGDKGTVGLLVMRSYILGGNARHYDAVIEQLESLGLRVIPAYASGLDSRPAIERFFMKDGKATVDAVLSLTGFSLVGGPAYNDANAAEDMLAELDVPYVSAHSTEFQSLESWEGSSSGLLPVETTLMVAIPELDGAIGPTLFAGRSEQASPSKQRDMQPHAERVDAMTRRVAKLVELRRSPRKDRRVAVVLFNFPPNGGSMGTAAFLSVFRSLFNTLRALKSAGYTVDLPADAEALKVQILEGNAERYGTDANVHTLIPADDHVRREPWLNAIEKEWGPAPGRQQSTGSSIQVLGSEFGNVFVGIQPAFGYEGDPMRLLFESGLAPTHAFSAFYRYLREDFGADAVLHFGTHGALEFMPGKQSGMSGSCWPDRLIGDMPNFYLYAANNPSEGAIAKRRSAATLISYLTPPVTQAGLYREFLDLEGSIERWRTLDPASSAERDTLHALIREQADEIDLAFEASDDADDEIANVAARLEEVKTTLIPQGLHVVGETVDEDKRREWLAAVAQSAGAENLTDGAVEAIISNNSANDALAGVDPEIVATLETVNRELTKDAELPALVHALDGRYIRPVPGGDLTRTTEILPTGRNLHSFDPYRIPSRYAVEIGAAQAEELLERYVADSGRLPESVAIVLWGTDNIKTEGGPIAQALRLIGARPRFDGYGRLAGAELIPLEELGRPRIDAIMTLSGIFRDLLPYQTKLLAEAAWLAATAENETLEQNFVRKHALAYAEDSGCDIETAALRVFSNANGAYGSNVNHLVDSSDWDDDNALADQYSRRKCFAYGRAGTPRREAEHLQRALKDVDFSYQNLESAELGITTIDHYFDTLGGISRAVHRAKGESVEVYIGDQTGNGNKIRTLSDQVALETRTRMLNPKWYENMLEHGYEGVRQIESHVTNTMGWSATTGKVAPWVYQQITNTFVLDEEMRRRLASLNPHASAKVANRLLEAQERDYWSPDAETLAALEKAGEELEDVLEGVTEAAVA